MRHLFLRRRIGAEALREAFGKLGGPLGGSALEQSVDDRLERSLANSYNFV